MNIYLVKHAHSIEYSGDDIFESKIIGIFSSKLKAEEAVKILKNKPGFVDYPDDFIIDDYEIDVIEWDQGFIKEELR
ncbi:hypothetical protein [Sphingobium sp. BS19]|uniref:DUF7336 domain-containing protein n=1 Tax=Sphingobium sp. BS19 TaxID=3018973 RepID=UPI0022EDD57A|nr:hypothetical protein [Sphingobium sp. BS19]GLJ00315.1 hypothetical protein Sbs19_41320 [Sphingobium sp. BS19]